MTKNKSLFQHTWHKRFWNFLADQYKKDHGFGDFRIGEYKSYELAYWKRHIAELYQEQTGSTFPYENNDYCFCCDYKRVVKFKDEGELESCKHCPLIWSDDQGNTLERCGSEGSPFNSLDALLEEHGNRILNSNNGAKDVFDPKIVELCRKIANIPVKEGVKAE